MSTYVQLAFPFLDSIYPNQDLAHSNIDNEPIVVYSTQRLLVEPSSQLPLPGFENLVEGRPISEELSPNTVTDQTITGIVVIPV